MWRHTVLSELRIAALQRLRMQHYSAYIKMQRYSAYMNMQSYNVCTEMQCLLHILS